MSSLAPLLTPLLSTLRLPLIAFGLFLVARLWAKVPALDEPKDEPPYLPYTVPLIAHTLSFITGGHQLLLEAARYFKMTPYTLKLGGAKMYIFTHPNDVKALFKNPQNLKFFENAAIFLRQVVGMKDSPIVTLEEFFQGGKVLEDGTVLPGIQTWLHQTLGGKENVQLMVDRSIKAIADTFEDELYKMRQSGEPLKTDLFSYVRWTLGKATTAATFGPNLIAKYPEALELFYGFDDEIWRLILNFPEMIAKKAYASREGFVKVFEKYHADNEEGRWLREGALALAVGMEETKIKAGFDLHSRARLMLPIMDAFNTNTLPISLWTIAFTLQHPKFIALLVEEVRPAFDADTGKLVDSEFLLSQTNCPHLHSVIFEALRFSTGSLSGRHVGADTLVNGYMIRKGGTAICPVRPLHLSEEAWGETAEVFNPYRFVERPQDIQPNKMRPFGSGTVLCPGRVYATAVMKVYIAMAFTNLDFELTAGVPKMNTTRPTISALKPIGEVPVKITLKKRAASQ